MALQLRLFGTPQILIDGQIVEFRNRKAALLLVLLALRPKRPIERFILAEAIWPEKDSEDASSNLRRALADLRLILGTEAGRLDTRDRRTLSLDADSDISDFDHHYRRFSVGSDSNDARNALELYQGELMHGWTAQCLEPERYHRAHMAHELSEELARRSILNRDPKAALRFCDKADEVAPLRESTLRIRLDAHLANRDHLAAFSAYSSFVRQLDRDFGLSPSEGLTQMMDRLPSPPTMTETHLQPRPYFGGELVGREAECDWLREAMRLGGLITIVGPGGVGKTRLAIQVSDGMDQTAWVDLTQLNADASVASVLDRIEVPAQILLLDNAEHLVPAISVAVEAIRRNYKCVLVTSRAPLRAPEEKVYRLEPLTIPDPGQPDAVLKSPAVRLFIQKAQSALPNRKIDLHAVVRICRRLEGLPLAIELAAARLSTIPLTELANAVDRDDGFLALEGAQVAGPSRHLAIRKTVDWSVSLLPEIAKNAISQLACFRAGFTLESAEALIGQEAFQVISLLAEHSLIHSDEASHSVRYRMLETVRTAVLRDDVSESLASRFADWAVDFSNKAYDGFWLGDTAKWSQLVALEKPNLKAALEIATPEKTDKILKGLEPIWWKEYNFREAIEWRQIAQAIAQRLGQKADEANHLLHIEQFKRLLGEPNQARKTFREVITDRLGREDFSGATYNLVALGMLELADGEFNRAYRTMQEAVEVAQKVTEPGFVPYAQKGVATVELARGNSEAARALLENVISVFKMEKLSVLETMASSLWGQALLEVGDLQGAFGILTLAAIDARQRNLSSVEFDAELGCVYAALSLNNLESAEVSIGRARALIFELQNRESQVLLACAESYLARHKNDPNPLITLRILIASGAANLSCPILMRLLEECVLTAEAIGPDNFGRRLRGELTNAAASIQTKTWSGGLLLARVLAAFPPDLIRKTLEAA